MHEASNDNRTSPLSPTGLKARDDFSMQNMGWLHKELEKRNINTLTPEECEANRRQTLRKLKLGQDLILFAYGSLMWNTTFEPAASMPVTIYGWRRSFCIDMLFGRGTPKKPGLMLALDKGGECHGVAHRISAAHIERDTPALWHQEMSAPLYKPSWVEAEIDGVPTRLLTFVIDQSSHLYSGHVELAIQARRIATAEGPLGRNRDYLYDCAAELKRRGIHDNYIEDLAARTRALAQEAAL